MLETGGTHACMTTEAGGVACWGLGLFGALGNGLTATSAIPVPVSLPTAAPVIDLAASERGACALFASGDVYCWGYWASTPAQLAGFPAGDPVVDVESSGHAQTSCALTAAGDIWCWGANDLGQLGIGSFASSGVPVKVGGGPYSSVSVGMDFVCATDPAGDLYCWGSNGFGTLGNGGGGAFSTVPVHVVPATPLVSVKAGSISACALSFAGAVYCWGDNTYGEARGDGTSLNGNVTTPTAVASLGTGIARLGAGNGTSYAITYSGNVLAWGLNAYGCVGSGSVAPKILRPVQVLGLSEGVESVGGGLDYFSCAVTTRGHAWCWGHNGNSNLPIAGDRSATPVFIR
jgi:alpha-tubulin suppressor-like RCC1 family protein